MLVEDDAQVRALEHLGKRSLSDFDRLAPLAVELEQIECAMHGAGDGPVTAYQFKNRQAVLVANDSLAVDQARPNRQRLNGHFDERKAAGEIIAVPRNELHAGRATPRQNAEAVMLDFV